MGTWPPAVLLAARQDVMRQALRDMLRRSGVLELEHRASCGEIREALAKDPNRWTTVILDAAFPDALEVVQGVREKFGPFPKVILICSGPTREDVLAAARAGVNDFFTYPVSQATIERKLRKLWGVYGIPGGGSDLARATSPLRRGA